MAMHKTYSIKQLAELVLSIFILIIFISSCKSENGELQTPPNENAKIALSIHYLDLSEKATSETFFLTSSTDWQILNTVQWITLSSQKGAAGKDIVIQLNILKNQKDSIRTAKIIAKSDTGMATDTLVIRQSGITSYIDIDWERDATLSSFNLKSGEININFKSGMPHFVAGISTIIVPTDSCNYIRTINDFRITGNNAILQTKEGNMTDIFRNQEFTLSTVPLESATVSRSGNINTTDNHGVIHPVQIVTRTDNGEEVILYDVKNPMQTRNMEIHETTGFFYWNKNCSGYEIFKERGVTLQWDKCLFEAALDGEFYFSFGESIQINNLGIEVPKGDLLGFYYLLKGSVNIDLLLHLIAKQKYSAQTDEPVALKSNIFGKYGLNLKFVIGNVPVFINVNPSLMSEASFEAHMRGDLTGGLNTGITVSCGLNYYKENGLPKAIGSINPYFNLYKPEIKVKGTIDASVSIYPDISILFYNFTGPRIKIIPTIGDEFRFGGQAGGESDAYASWTNRLYQQLDAKGQLELHFVGKTYSSPEIPLVSEVKQNNIFLTPYDVEFANKSISAEIGQPIIVTATVTDYSLLHETPPVSSGITVYYEVYNGKINQDVALTNMNGNATITYTPLSENSYLRVKILDAEKNEIASDVLKPNLKPNLQQKVRFEGTYRGINADINKIEIDNISFRADGTYEYKYYNDIRDGKEVDGYYILDRFCRGTFTTADAHDTGDFFILFTTFCPTEVQDNSKEYTRYYGTDRFIVEPSSLMYNLHPAFHSIFGLEGKYQTQIESIDANGIITRASFWYYSQEGRLRVEVFERIAD